MPQFSTSYQRYGGRYHALWDLEVCLNQRVICSSRQTGAGAILVRVVMVSSPVINLRAPKQLLHKAVAAT
jgi:hypothetical protein